jgi:hypothetical protein
MLLHNFNPTLMASFNIGYLQQYFRFIMVVSFIGGRNGYPEKTTDLPQVAKKLKLYKM